LKGLHQPYSMQKPRSQTSRLPEAKEVLSADKVQVGSQLAALSLEFHIAS
jgi:hypothetical protein